MHMMRPEKYPVVRNCIMSGLAEARFTEMFYKYSFPYIKTSLKINAYYRGSSRNADSIYTDSL